MIETERLILRPWQEQDAEDLYTYASNPEVGPPAGWPPHTSVDNSREIIKNVLSKPETYAVCLKDGTPIGSIGLHLNGSTDMTDRDDECELGYWIGKPYWNRGLCTEALRAMVDYCFNTVGYETLWSDYFVDNPASGRVMERCGFRDTGEENWLSHLYRGDERPVKVMRLDYALG